MLDEHTHMRSSVETCLTALGFDAVVLLTSLRAAREYLASHVMPTLVVLDLRLPDGLSTELMPSLRDRGVPVVVFTESDDAYSVRTAFAAGASAFVLKSDAAAALSDAIRGAVLGEHLMSEDIADLLVQGVQLAAANGTPELTRREIDVLRLAAQGLSNAEIAKELLITTLAVKGHFAVVGRKLGVHSRTGMVAVAMRAHLIA